MLYLTRLRKLSVNSVAILLIILNIYFSYKGFNDINFFNKYKFNPSYIKRGERIRYLSSGFLHVDTTHLIVNMFTFYFFADSVIYRVGEMNFLIIYFASLIFVALRSLSSACKQPAVAKLRELLIKNVIIKTVNNFFIYTSFQN